MTVGDLLIHGEGLAAPVALRLYGFVGVDNNGGAAALTLDGDEVTRVLIDVVGAQTNVCAAESFDPE